jgi:hypothetical protein
MITVGHWRLHRRDYLQRECRLILIYRISPREARLGILSLWRQSVIELVINSEKGIDDRENVTVFIDDVTE